MNMAVRFSRLEASNTCNQTNTSLFVIVVIVFFYDLSLSSFCYCALASFLGIIGKMIGAMHLGKCFNEIPENM